MSTSTSPEGVSMEGIPTSFKYFENRQTPAGHRRARAIERFSRNPVGLPDVVASQLGRDCNRGDALSDAFIEQAFAAGAVKQAREQVETALAEGIAAVENPLPGLAELFAHLDATPEWLDWQRVERGARVFRRYGTDAFRFFGLISIGGYRVEVIQKPLVLTGAYTGGTAFGRYLETCKFWTEVSEPGGLGQGQEGRKTAVLVRILHSIIRHHIGPHAEWDDERMGVPISQNAQFGTIALSFMLTQQLKLIGYRVTETEVLDHMHFWRYVAYLMGVESAFYPDSVQDWWSTMYLLLLQDVPNDGADSLRLGQSFVAAFGPTSGDSGQVRRRKQREQREVLGWTQFFLDAGSYRAMKLEPAGLYRWSPLLKVPRNAVDSVRLALAGGTSAAIDERQRRSRRAWLDLHTVDRPAKFAPVEKLSR